MLEVGSVGLGVDIGVVGHLLSKRVLSAKAIWAIDNSLPLTTISNFLDMVILCLLQLNTLLILTSVYVSALSRQELGMLPILN